MTHRCDHDGVVQEAESHEGDGVVEQDCRPAGEVNTHSDAFS